jgi:hypothetical protein
MTRITDFCGQDRRRPEDFTRQAALPTDARSDMVAVSEHFSSRVDGQSAAGFARSTTGAIAKATPGLDSATVGAAPPRWIPVSKPRLKEPDPTPLARP